MDLTIGYKWDTNSLGLFRAQLAGSWNLEYDLVDPQGNKIDGIGSRNASNSVGHPMPEFKINLQLGWAYDRHAAVATVRYVDSFKDDLPQSALRGAFIGFAPTIDSWTTADVQYTYQLPAFSIQGEGSSIMLGVKNLTNEKPPRLNNDGGYDPFTHDPRGRIFYARYTLAL
jgi:outer membrane receptor protein involved in Fe transport